MIAWRWRSRTGHKGFADRRVRPEMPFMDGHYLTKTGSHVKKKHNGGYDIENWHTIYGVDAA